MSDKDETRARVRTMLDDTTKTVQPLLETMVESMRQTYTAAATLANDPITPANEDFWGIVGNLFVQANGKLDAAGPEIAALVELSKGIATTSSYDAWASSAAICQRLFDNIDGGEELGLSGDFLSVDWTDVEQRAVALLKGMQFHRVPRSYQGAVANVVADLMFAMPQAWQYEGSQLSQQWAMCCTYVVYAIAERLKAGYTGHEGQGRGASLH